MEKLKLEIMSSIAERKEELRKVSKAFIEVDMNNKNLVWSSELSFMQVMLEDLDSLRKMLTRLKRADELEKLDDEEVEALIDEEVERLRLETLTMHKDFMDDRSLEDYIEIENK